MQGIFYLLQYDKQGIVEEGTQKFNWKTAKEKIDEDFIQKMQEYKICGEKKQQFNPY